MEIINSKEDIDKLEKRPKLLLHACCGPCFTIPHEILKDHFDITIMYNNSNIYPKKEHDRRLNELKKYLSDLGTSIKVILKICNSKRNSYLWVRPYACNF